MAIRLEKQGQRIYLLGDTYGMKDQIKAMGGHWDADRRAWWVGTKKEAEARQLAEGGAGPPTKQNPDDIRLTGKGRYKGRVYYAGSITRDGTRVRLLTLPDTKGEYLDFWAPCAEVEEIKRYAPREYRGRQEYTTLGSIARFIEKERRARERGDPVCAACGKSGELVQDLEDGLMKHRGCCDIEP